MSNKQAWLFAASWGSYMNSGDPGACLYGFDEHFAVQSEGHRAACIAQMVNNRAYVEAHPSDYEPDELEQIDALLSKLETAEVQS
ncbi:MAG: hypothetical protein ACJ8FS_16520 [Sphingomicrobium sp.]